MADSEYVVEQLWARIDARISAASAPEGGWPLNDLSSEVQGKLTHADTTYSLVTGAVSEISEANGGKLLRVGVGGGIVNEIGKVMGVNVTLKPAPQSYELLSSGVMDGVFFPAESVASFKLDKLIKYETKFPGGLYNTSFAIVMNPDAWAKISKEDQEAITKLSNVALAQRIGRNWDAADRHGTAVMQANNVEVVNASKAFIDEVKAKTSKLEDKWISEAKAKGLKDPAEVLKEYRALIAAN